MNNPAAEGYDIADDIKFFEQQAERTKKRAQIAVSRNATTEEISALGAKMRHYKAAIAALKIVGRQDDE